MTEQGGMFCPLSFDLVAFYGVNVERFWLAVSEIREFDISVKGYIYFIARWHS